MNRSLNSLNYNLQSFLHIFNLNNEDETKIVVNRFAKIACVIERNWIFK
jgi:hypothetical protein